MHRYSTNDDAAARALHRFETLVDAVRYHAIHSADKTAYTMLKKGRPDSGLTYRDLHLRALAFADKLRVAGMEQGDRALLLFPSGTDFIIAFLGCLDAGVVAVPAPLPARRQNKLGNTANIVSFRRRPPCLIGV